MQSDNLIYDWNRREKSVTIPRNIEVCDETLRDGIQSPSVVDPSLVDKLELVTLMDKIGVTIADIGLPGAGPRAYKDVVEIAKFVKKEKLKIHLNCAARTVVQDIEPIARAQQEAGIKIAAYCFLGTSPIRQLVENWDLDSLKRTSENAINFAHKHNLEVAFVTEDTTRSHPNTLRVLFEHAINLGCRRLVLCDTVGHASPDGVRCLLKFTKELIEKSNEDVKIDWHGHNDRGLGVSNALVAAESGCHRIHGTALGVGERVGNTAIDQLILNLKLLECYDHDVKDLVTYVETAARACQIDLPYNYPLCGKDAFRTATGVHAAAVIKAQKKGDSFLADTIYSGVPAYWFGKNQEIEIGPMSGASNVKYWLEKNQCSNDQETIEALLEFAKSQPHVLSHVEIDHFLKTK